MAQWRCRYVQKETFFLSFVCVAAVEVLLLTWMSGQQQEPPPEFFLPSHRYITVEFTSRRRLGNLLFDYAALLGIARCHNMTAVMPSSFPPLRVFDLKVKVMDGIYQQSGTWSRFSERSASKYDSRVESKLPNSPQGHVILHGFYQSWKYFSHIERELRGHLQFKARTRAAAEIFLHSTTNKNNVIVGIHVRRGDILTADDIIGKGYNTPDEQYYIKAMDFFRTRYPHVQFVICTDSSEWAEQHLSGADVVFSPGRSAEVDLAILSLSDHVIMSVGTFGWWGAWLANGTTVYYDGWPEKGSYLSHTVSHKDYFPAHWIPMH